MSVLQLMDEEAAALLAEVKEVIEQGEQLLQAAEDCRDPVTHARVSNRLQDVKVSVAVALTVYCSVILLWKQSLCWSQRKCRYTCAHSPSVVTDYISVHAHSPSVVTGHISVHAHSPSVVTDHTSVHHVLCQATRQYIMCCDRPHVSTPCAVSDHTSVHHVL